MENETTELQTEVKNPEALLKKNRDLLRELNEAKAALKAAQDALEAAQGVNAKLEGDLYRACATEPLKAIVQALSPSPGLMTRALSDLMDIRLDDDHKPLLFNKEGKPLTWVKKLRNGFTEDVPVELDRESIVQWILNGFEGNPDGPQALLPKAQGAGATGSSGGFASSARKPTATPTPTAVTPLGLR